MAGQLDELSAAIGDLRAQIRLLTESHDRERQGAEQHRHAMRDVIGSLSQSVRTLAEKVSEMQPYVSDYRDKSQQAKGAAMSVKYIWAAIAALLGTFGASVLDLGKWLRPPHP